MYSPPMGPVPAMVSLFETQWGLDAALITAATPLPASATWESANRAVYMPIVTRAPCVAYRVWWANGTTTTGGATIEVGIYAQAGYAPGTKLVSGSATQGTADAVQFVDVTDTVLPVGLYWIAISSSSITNTTLYRTSIGTAPDQAVRFEEASASPLPATATPVVATAASLWLCGFATTASP